MSSCELKHICGHIGNTAMSRLIEVPTNTVYWSVVLCDISEVFTNAGSKAPFGLSHIHVMTYCAFNTINKIIAFAIAVANSSVSGIGQCTQHSATNVQSVTVLTIVAGTGSNFRVM